MNGLDVWVANGGRADQQHSPSSTSNCELAVATVADHEGCTVWIPGDWGGNQMELTPRQMRLLAAALLQRIPHAERAEYLDGLAAPVGPTTVFADIGEVELDGQQHFFAADRSVGHHNERHAGIPNRDLVPHMGLLHRLRSACGWLLSLVRKAA